ncbi:MAG: N,N-dimethylformamidase [Gammaproteobacteria bacterium]|jgi:N,N-dimethylformamidase
MVSSASEQPYDVQLMRIICADPNPDGPGIIEEEVESPINGSYPSRVQDFHAGSYAKIKSSDAILTSSHFTLSANIYPTLLADKEQIVLAIGNLALFINEQGCLAGRIGSDVIAFDQPLKSNRWYCDVQMSYDALSGHLSVSYVGVESTPRIASTTVNKDSSHFEQSDFITMAAGLKENHPAAHFNGKIESPKITVNSNSGVESVLAAWDFSQCISSTQIIDTGPNSLNGNLINLPTRAVTGSNWDGSEMCWRHAPDQYAAIHFHDDDIYDFNWLPDFSLLVPENLPSGIYAARIRSGKFEDYLPFFICPPKGKRSADLCVLISTFTYVIYGNHARPDFGPDWEKKTANWNAYPWNPAQHREYGLSTYNTHSDGSGICHASHRRPLLNLRPGYLTFNYGRGSGLRHFQADSHLIAWLHAMNTDYDIITDEELHTEGVTALSGYKVVTTGTHPEYHTEQTLDALTRYRDQGGRFMYLGGNGFYWRIARHKDESGVIEIRRGEGGIRAWASEPGEYYNAFDGAYGGLWRRNARPPQQLAGIGFSAQGEFYGSYYRRRTGTDAPPSATWIFEGIDEDILGDFGLSGGGAAGFELDRADHRLGSPDDIQILASSEGHNDGFILVPEEQLTHITNLPGEPTDKLIRADMVYFQVPGGGEVFATGSITFCGSLPHNNFDNNISRLLKNVTDRFLL